jgi:hypothetical protein
MKNLMLSAALLISLNALSQDCGQEILKKKPGTWKAGPQSSVRNVSAADLAKEKLVIGSIRKMVSTNYQPTGCQVSTSEVYGKYPEAGQTWMADPYHFAMYILRYLCDKNSADKSKHYVEVSSATNVNIAANVIFSSGNIYAATIPESDFRGYLKLKQRPQKKEGAWFMGEEVISGEGTARVTKEYSWLITYDDALPFYYVSRKEYLLLQKKRLEKAVKDDSGNKQYYDQYFKNISDYLAKSEAELNRPAVCMWNDEERFTGFVEENTKGSFIAIKPNPAYYNTKLPKSSPQFFTVVYKFTHGDPVFEENISGIQKAVNFIALKNMLGK